MSDLNNVKEFLEKAIAANSKALEVQMGFYESFTRRQGETLVKLADERINSLKSIANCGSFEKAVEKNGEFESLAKEALEALHKSNVAAFEEFSASLKNVYNV